MTALTGMAGTWEKTKYPLIREFRITWSSQNYRVGVTCIEMEECP